MDVFLHPIETVARWVRDPWLVFRVILCSGVFVAFAFWDRSNYDDTPISESEVEGDRVVQALQWLYDVIDQDDVRTRIPIISSHVFCFFYAAMLAHFIIYIRSGDFIFPAMLSAWLVALTLTLITRTPRSPTAINYDLGPWFPFESFATDNTVSWHFLFLYLSGKSIYAVYPYWPMYLLRAGVLVLVSGYMLATHNTYTKSLALAWWCAEFGVRFQDIFRQRYEAYRRGKDYGDLAEKPMVAVVTSDDGVWKDEGGPNANVSDIVLNSEHASDNDDQEEEEEAATMEHKRVDIRDEHGRIKSASEIPTLSRPVSLARSNRSPRGVASRRVAPGSVANSTNGSATVAMANEPRDVVGIAFERASGPRNQGDDEANGSDGDDDAGQFMRPLHHRQNEWPQEEQKAEHSRDQPTTMTTTGASRSLLP